MGYDVKKVFNPVSNKLCTVFNLKTFKLKNHARCSFKSSLIYVTWEDYFKVNHLKLDQYVILFTVK